MPPEKQLKAAVMPPIVLVLAIWLVHTLGWALDVSFSFLGIFPRSLEGMPGIILSPLIHGDWGHLIANTGPLLILGSLSLLTFPVMTLRAVVLILFISGICTWLGGRPSYHIGASGIIYGLAAFLLVGGIITKKNSLKAISLIVIFLYAGLVAGLFPGSGTNISWEGHLFGAIAGIVAAAIYARQEPDFSEEQQEYETAEVTDWDYARRFPEKEIVLKNDEEN